MSPVDSRGLAGGTAPEGTCRAHDGQSQPDFGLDFRVKSPQNVVSCYFFAQQKQLQNLTSGAPAVSLVDSRGLTGGTAPQGACRTHQRRRWQVATILSRTKCFYSRFAKANSHTDLSTYSLYR